jgi:NAD(P)H dehydrogenase (quinone)
MNHLVILAHPAPESLCHALAEAAVEGLGGSGQATVRRIDLYQDYRRGFDPILGFGSVDGRRRRDMKDEAALAPYREALIWADHLVIVHPLWWGRAPALLEGWFDRVLAAGFAFDYPAGSTLPRGLLKGRRATVVMTADAGCLTDRLYYRRQHQRRLSRDVLGFCGFRKIRFLPVYAVKHRSPAAISAEIGRVRRHFAGSGPGARHG